MSAQTISLRLPEEEVAILNLLSDRERAPKPKLFAKLCSLFSGKSWMSRKGLR